MAQKRQTIVIKKIIVQGGGHHGGSWKVALADFMTAMMAFFLVMWLLGQNEETKKAVSDYFSTPSVVEYNFQNFGAELTLEKLFLDLVNEPLKAFQSFLEPADKTPNVLDMGSAKVVAAFMADKLTDTAKNVNITRDGFDFDIPDTYLFEKGTAQPNAKFIDVMNQVSQVTSGLKDSDIKITSFLFAQAVGDQKVDTAKKVAQDRLDLVTNKVKATFENSTNAMTGAVSVKDRKAENGQGALMGFIRISIRQKETESKSRRKLETMFGEKDSAKTVYDNFATQVSERKKAANGADPNLKKQGQDPGLTNPVDAEIRQVQDESNPVSEVGTE